MPSVNLGRVSIVPKGVWSNSATYEKLDVVTYGGGSYIANKDVPAGTSLSTAEYWSNFVGSFNIGTVDTVSASTGASAELITTSTGQTLNLSIPRGVAGNESIDDTKGEGDTDYVWSADKSYKEINNLQNEINDKVDSIITTSTNNIFTFEAKNNDIIKNLEININPIQNLNGYATPWPDGTKENQLDLEAYVKHYTNNYSIDSNGWITINSLSAAGLYANTWNVGPFNNGSIILLIDPTRTTATNVRARIYNNGIGKDTENGNPSSTKLEGEQYDAIGLNWSDNGTATIKISCVSTSTISSWTPYANICPIYGSEKAIIYKTQKNLFPIDSWYETGYSTTVEGVTYTVQADGGVKIHGTANEQSTFYVSKAYIDPIVNPFYLKNGTYRISYTGLTDSNAKIVLSGSEYNGVEYKEKSSDGNDSITVTNEMQPFRYIYFKVENNNSVSTTVYFQIEQNSNLNNNYESPNTEILLNSWSTTAGIVYNGNYNIINGLLTSNYKQLIIDGSETGWSAVGGSYPQAYKLQNNILFSDIKKVKQGKQNLITNIYPFMFLASGNLGIRTADSSNNTLYFYNSKYQNDLDGFLSSLQKHPVQIIYELESATTYQLTPYQIELFENENNLWCNTGTTKIEIKFGAGDLYKQNNIDYLSNQIINKPDVAYKTDIEDIKKELKYQKVSFYYSGTKQHSSTIDQAIVSISTNSKYYLSTNVVAHASFYVYYTDGTNEFLCNNPKPRTEFIAPKDIRAIGFYRTSGYEDEIIEFIVEYQNSIFLEIDNNTSLSNFNKERITLANNKGLQTILPYGNFQHYGLNEDGSFKLTQTNRVSNDDKMVFDYDIMFHIDNGFKCGYIPFINNIAGTWVGWLTEPFIIKAGTVFNLQIAKTPSEPPGIADIKEFTDAIKIDTYLKSKLDRDYEYSYKGEIIKTKQGKYNCYTSNIYAPNTTSISTNAVQGFAMANNYAVQFYSDNNVGKCAIIDMSSSTSTIVLESNCLHGNTADFFNEKYNEEDILPIAFVADGLTNKAFEARIQASGVTILKTIKFPIENCGYYVSTMLDKDNMIVYTVGYYANSYTSATNNKMVIAMWDYSNLTENEDDTYSPTFIKKFYLPFFSTLQGPTFYNGKLYIISSLASSSNANTRIFIIDPYTEKITNILTQFPHIIKDIECESMYFYETENEVICYIRPGYGTSPYYELDFNT